ncbi:hypothetical protein PGT21_020648 [Puccinia graminis f. sp. tritici]|uniref:Uncharacterized protein n=1 Tax=Puccinia graminis f. sp. tritici TaxID=56615 RepID=A0A5B0PY89_PUCGR|nr:hypothetical protein PGT21_020648 [Puccinia graminis f. sp. tritici]KAA1135102.1 hypothetical protein PGTUg99_010170 [Puccinia graminis f. sp. tritici]
MRSTLVEPVFILIITTKCDQEPGSLWRIPNTGNVFGEKRHHRVFDLCTTQTSSEEQITEKWTQTYLQVSYPHVMPRNSLRGLSKKEIKNREKEGPCDSKEEFERIVKKRKLNI